MLGRDKRNRLTPALDVHCPDPEASRLCSCPSQAGGWLGDWDIDTSVSLATVKCCVSPTRCALPVAAAGTEVLASEQLDGGLWLAECPVQLRSQCSRVLGPFWFLTVWKWDVGDVHGFS